jgi:hypothetical protein
MGRFHMVGLAIAFRVALLGLQVHFKFAGVPQILMLNLMVVFDEIIIKALMLATGSTYELTPDGAYAWYSIYYIISAGCAVMFRMTPTCSPNFFFYVGLTNFLGRSTLTMGLHEACRVLA